MLNVALRSRHPAPDNMAGKWQKVYFNLQLRYSCAIDRCGLVVSIVLTWLASKLDWPQHRAVALHRANSLPVLPQLWPLTHERTYFVQGPGMLYEDEVLALTSIPA